MTGVRSPEAGDHDWDIDHDADSDEFDSNEEFDNDNPADGTVTLGSDVDGGDQPGRRD
jgi:hypothetical protein